MYIHTVYTHLQISMIPKWHKMMAGVNSILEGDPVPRSALKPQGAAPHRTFEEACLLVPLRPLRRCGYCHLWSHRVSEEWRRRFCREQKCKGFQHLSKPVGPSDVPVAILAIWESVACRVKPASVRSRFADKADRCEESHFALCGKPGHLQWPQATSN